MMDWHSCLVNRGVDGSVVWIQELVNSSWKSGIADGLGMDIELNFILDVGADISDEGEDVNEDVAVFDWE